MNYKNYRLRWILMGVSVLAIYVGLAAGPAQGRERSLCEGGNLDVATQARCDSQAAWDAALARRDIFLGAWEAFFSFAHGACEGDDLDAATQAHCDSLADARDDLPLVCFRVFISDFIRSHPLQRHLSGVGARHLLDNKNDQGEDPGGDQYRLSEETQQKCHLIRFLGEHNHHLVRLAPRGAIRSIHLIETGSGREVVASYPYGRDFAAEDDGTREIRMKVEALEGFSEGRPTPGTVRTTALAAPEGFATGLPIGWNTSSGPTPGQCFNYTIATPSNNVQQASFSSQNTANSTAEQINVSATVAASFDLFKVSDTASFSDKWQASSFSSNQYYNFYSLYTLDSTVSSDNPLNTQGSNAVGNFSTLCGSQYMAAVPVGMVATMSLNYGSTSNSTQTAISNQLDASYGLASVSVAVGVSKQDTNANSYFTFRMVSYGGGTGAAAALQSAFAKTNASGQAFYALCAQGNTDACTTFSGNMGGGASAALQSFNSKVDDLSGATNPDLSFFQTFPSGVSGANLPQLVTAEVPTVVSDVLASYATQLEEYVDLVNQVSTLNNRANQLNARVEADPRHNYIPLLDLTTTLRALGSKDDRALYAAARATLLDNLENCLEATKDNVTEICAPIINNQIANAFEYFAAGGPGNNFLAQQNTIALQYTALSGVGNVFFPEDVVYISKLPALSSDGSDVPITGEAALMSFSDQFPGSGGAELLVLTPGLPISTENLSDKVKAPGGTFALWRLINPSSVGGVGIDEIPSSHFTSSACTPDFANPCDIEYVFFSSTNQGVILRRIDGLFQ